MEESKAIANSISTQSCRRTSTYEGYCRHASDATGHTNTTTWKVFLFWASPKSCLKNCYTQRGSRKWAIEAHTWTLAREKRTHVPTRANCLGRDQPLIAPRHDEKKLEGSVVCTFVRGVKKSPISFKFIFWRWRFEVKARKGDRVKSVTCRIPCFRTWPFFLCRGSD